MKKLKFLGGFLAALALVSLSGAAFNIFQPATGILVGNASTYVTTAATSANVIGLWSGTCNSSTVLNGAGACTSAGATTGTFTGTLTGMTTTVTTTCNYTLVGNAVTVVCEPASGTSNANTFHLTGLPAAILPTSGTDAMVGLTFALENSSTNSIAAVDIENFGGGTGGMLFYLCASISSCTPNTWATSGTKGIATFGLVATYNL